MRLPANELAPSAARKFVRTALAECGSARSTGPAPASPQAVITDELADDAVLLVSELVTNAIMYAGTDVEVGCHLDSGPGPLAPSAAYAPGPSGVVVEVVDRNPSRAVRGGKDAWREGRGRGLQLVRALAESWGVIYRHSEKSVWFRLETAPAAPAPGGSTDTAAADAAAEDARQREPRTPGILPPSRPRPRRGRTAEWVDRSGPTFLAEAGELLAGQLDEDMVAAIAGQLLVPRLADWCGVWLTTESGAMRLSRVWHTDERCIGELRLALENDPPPARLPTTGIPWPWPQNADAAGEGGAALLFPLVASGSCHGAVLIGRKGVSQMTDGLVRLAEDVARRVAHALATARHYTKQATISRALQRRQLPESLAEIPGFDTAIVYEPRGEGQTVGGDFYDLFPMGDVEDRRWCFLLGDVMGHDVEAMSVTGLARHLVRLLAREGHGVESLLARLNLALAEEGAEAVAVGGEQAGPRFLSLLYGELEPDPVHGGGRCTVASAGHPLPLLLSADGEVEPAADPQLLLGISESAEFHASSFRLAPGETLLCVTDGVTERRRGNRQLDDADGLAEVLRGCVGMGAKAVAERVRQAAHDFDTSPIDDDLAVMVIEATPEHVPGAGPGAEPESARRRARAQPGPRAFRPTT
ncbi:SpoIIE family protein phosphatase [Streptomyces wuyuanensis]|uniref:SpoIIE family protein phosphatase n=1 Tax=Streptomyces wuyuanensis TaxID=1196353 RepID=UPI0036A4B0BE